MTFVWPAIIASIVFTIVYIAWLVFGSTANAVDNEILNNPVIGSASVNGFTVGAMMTQSNGLYAAGVVSIIVFLGAYVLAAAHAEEDDSGVLG